MRRILLGCVLAGCGRVGFDVPEAPRADATATDSAADSSAPLAPPCALGGPVADPLTISGETFVYSGFANTTNPVASVNVSASIGALTVAVTTSDASGLYTLQVPTGGNARFVTLRYAPAGYWTTELTTDRPLDQSFAGPNTDKWRLGDGPVWNGTGMGLVYQSVGMPLDPSKGTLNIAVRTCAEESIPGVTLEITPPPALFRYIDDMGVASGTMATVDPYASATGFNAEPGVTRIHATAPGYTFQDVDITTQPGDVMTYVELHPSN